MKKEEVTGILQNEFVFDRLSGSAGRSGPIRGLSMMQPVIPDGCHVTFTLQDYRRSFNIGTLDRREVFVKMEYDLVDVQSGFYWTTKKVLSTKVMSKNNTISERFE